MMDTNVVGSADINTVASCNTNVVRSADIKANDFVGIKIFNYLFKPPHLTWT